MEGERGDLRAVSDVDQMGNWSTVQALGFVGLLVPCDKRFYSGFGGRSAHASAHFPPTFSRLSGGLGRIKVEDPHPLAGSIQGELAVNDLARAPHERQPASVRTTAIGSVEDGVECRSGRSRSARECPVRPDGHIAGPASTSARAAASWWSPVHPRPAPRPHRKRKAPTHTGMASAQAACLPLLSP